jgi:hypothetical protein
MEYVYIINENGVVYPLAYLTYELAVAAIEEKYSERLEEERTHGTDTACEIDLPENESGLTEWYIEKGINIDVIRIPISRKN